MNMKNHTSFLCIKYFSFTLVVDLYLMCHASVSCGWAEISLV